MSLWRALGPALPRPSGPEALRAAAGAGFGLLLTALLLWALAPSAANLPLIAPFGASAFLIFAVPNSPLAQPWSVVVGNTLSALAALLVLQTGLAPLIAAPLAVALAALAMAASRAMHPPGGAVALFTALAAPDAVTFALSPVLSGSLALVILGILWNRATGRAYPFRQSPPSPHGTADPAPERRHLPPPGAMADLLATLRLGANIGVEDLTRLITAAEAEAAARPLAGLTAAHLMSRDLITVGPDTPLPALADSFRSHRFKTLPVVQNGLFLGLVPESALIGRADPDLIAQDLTAPETVTAPPSEPAAHLVKRLADGLQQAIPIVDNGHLVGLVTRSDLIALLARPL